MPTYVVEGQFRGRFYSGQSLDVALKTLQREIHECRVQHQGPTDAQLYCDGALIETELGIDGILRIARERPRVEHPPFELPKKHWQR